MPCEVRTGTVWDAIEFGIQDNLKHRGERLSNADRAHNIRLVLKTNVKLSNSAIAQLGERSEESYQSCHSRI